MRWEIELERRTKNRLNPDITQRKLRTLAVLVEQHQTLGFKGKVSKFKEPERTFDSESLEESYVYTSRVVITNSQTSDPTAIDATFQRHILEAIRKQATIDGWTVLPDRVVATQTIPSISGGEVEVPLSAVADESASRPMFEIPELNDEAYAKFFGSSRVCVGN